MRLSWTRLAKKAGLSPRTLFDLRAGERTFYRADTLDRLELALDWSPGSVDRVLAGRQPQRKRDADMARIERVWPELSPEARRMVADLAERWHV